MSLSSKCNMGFYECGKMNTHERIEFDYFNLVSEITQLFIVNGASPLDGLKKSCDLIKQVVSVQVIQVWLIDEYNSKVQIYSEDDFFTGKDEVGDYFEAENTLIKQILVRREPQISNNEPGNFLNEREKSKFGIGSYAGFPIFEKDNLVGVVAYYFTSEIPPEIIKLLTCISNILSLGVAQIKLQNSLSEYQQRIENIFSSNHFMLVLFDKHFNFIKVNEAYAKACNYSPEYLLGKNHFDIFPHKEIEEIFKNVLETGNPHTESAKVFEFPNQPVEAKHIGTGLFIL